LKPKIVFMGTPDFAVPALTMLVEEGYPVAGVVTQPDRPRGRKRQPQTSPVKQAAERFGLPILQPERLRDESSVADVLALKPDLIVTAAYGQILPDELLTVPPLRCVNIHASLLPRYRGGAPIHWAIVNGESETGITLMYMASRLDAGDILQQESIPITQMDDVGTLHDKLSHLGAKMLRQLIPDLVAGRVNPIPQVEEEATFAPNIKREDERLDFTKSAQQLFNHVRGFRPWPGTFTEWRGKRLKIWDLTVAKLKDHTEPPGTILSVDGALLVATGQGAVLISELQVEGKKRISAAEWIRGYRVQIGERLGEEL
jgi:methionyl-tRNA formyltransferase